MRRALAIDEASYGAEHPNVAIRLNNLAQLLQATNRLGEAEPLMRRALAIWLAFTAATGHCHPHLTTGLANYRGLLKEMGIADTELEARVDALCREAGLDPTVLPRAAQDPGVTQPTKPTWPARIANALRRLFRRR